MDSDIPQIIPASERTVINKSFPTQILPINDNAVNHEERVLESKKQLWNLLARTIPKSGFIPPPDGQLTILNMGCGKTPEGLVLTSYFGGNDFEVNNEKIRHVGIDALPGYVENSQDTYRDYPNFDFYESDLEDRRQYPQEAPQQADIVVFKNPGPFHHDIYYHEALSHVAPNGIAVFKFLLDDDYENVKKILSKAPDYDIVIDGKIDVGNTEQYAMIVKPKSYQQQPLKTA